MTDLTQIKELVALGEKATQGSTHRSGTIIYTDKPQKDGYVYSVASATGDNFLADIAYLSAALNARPALKSLCEEVERLREEFENARITTQALLENTESQKQTHDALLKKLAALRNHMEDCVADRLDELNAEAEAFDKECWNVLRKLCEDFGLDWDDYPDGLTSHNAYDHIHEAVNEQLAAKDRLLDEAVDGLRRAKTYWAEGEFIAEKIQKDKERQNNDK